MSRLDYRQLPWMFPSPVRGADFAPLYPHHRDYAVTVDPSRVRRFSVEQLDDEDLIYSDRQAPPWGGSWHRLGSGRAGFYRGKYLKGVGRTPLAANWNQVNDWYHGTGHLFPSSAVRELFTTVYLQARGLGHLIVPCEGVLLGRLSEPFRLELRESFGDEWAVLAPADRALQAISVKPADFARMSNFLAILPAMSGWAEEWRVVGPLLEQYSAAPEAPAATLESCRTTSIVRSLHRSARRTLGSFEDYFAQGVQWNSIRNNFTLDGRFLDMEVSTLACRPFFGALQAVVMGAAPGGRNPPSDLCGLEQIDAAVELHVGIGRLRDQIQSLVNVPLTRSDTERKLLQELLALLKSLNSSSLFSKNALVEAALRRFATLGRSGPDLEQDIASYYFERRSSYLEPYVAQTRLEPTPLRFSRIEPALAQDLWLAQDFTAADWEDAEFMNALFDDVLTCSDVDRTLSSIQDAVAAIRRRFDSAAAGGSSK